MIAFVKIKATQNVISLYILIYRENIRGMQVQTYKKSIILELLSC